MNELMISLLAYDPTTDITAVFTTVGTALGVIVPGALALWAVLFTVGYGKKAAKKSAA